MAVGKSVAADTRGTTQRAEALEAASAGHEDKGSWEKAGQEAERRSWSSEGAKGGAPEPP